MKFFWGAGDTDMGTLVPMISSVAATGILYLVFNYAFIPRHWSKKAQLIGSQNPERITGLECSYGYLRQIYGKHHWAPFVNKLSPTLREKDEFKYNMVLEIMDVVHLCLILVDDVSVRPHIALLD
jgi:geranylgeranyldiphosphate transferase